MIHSASVNEEEQFQSSTSQRAAVYELLGRFWLAEIDQPLLDLLRSNASFQTAIREAGVDVSELNGIEVNQTALAEDFCQLFLGPTNHLPPYQSVWIDGQFAGTSSVEMRAWCDIAGIETGTTEADHLGIQLSVMARVVLSKRTDAEARFFQQHLTWTDALTRLANERARTSFYASIVHLTARFLEGERENLASRA